MNVEFEEFDSIEDIFLYMACIAQPMKSVLPINSYKGYVCSIIPLSHSENETYLMVYTKAELKTGNAMQLKNIPSGQFVHNIEMIPGKGAQMARSAGAYVQVMAHDNNYVTLKMPSGEVRMVPEKCLATVGVVGNKQHELVRSGKAGRSRWLGKRPKVRGVAMNPVDHPHGGGEGKSSGGRHPVTPWGKPTKGYKTRKKNKKSNALIVKRRND